MNTNALKINIAQQIFDTNDMEVLEKISDLLNKEVIVGYSSDGQPISKADYIKDMLVVEDDIKYGKLDTYSTQEVRDRIFNQ